MSNMKDRAYDIAWAISEGLVGHCAMESVTGYVVKDINETYGTDFSDTSELVAFAEGNGGEVVECPMCGWYVDYLDWISGAESIDSMEHEGCEDCIQDIIKED